MKRYNWYYTESMIENPNGGFVRWLDHVAALFRKGQEHVEDLVSFHDTIRQQRLKIEQLELEIKRLTEKLVR